MGLGDFLFGKSPSQEIKSRKTTTPEQDKLFEQLFSPTIKKRLESPSREAPSQSQDIEPTEVTPAPSAPALALINQFGLPSAPTTSGEDVSLTGLEERARKISSGEAFGDNISNLSALSSLFQQGTGSSAVSGALNTTPSDLASQVAPILEMFGDTEKMPPEMQQALSTLLSGEAQGIDEFFRESVRAPLLEDFQEEILPSISRRFSGNFFGSDRRKADQRAQEDLLDTLAKERASLAFQARRDALDRISQGLGIGQQDLARQEQGRQSDVSGLLQAIGQAGNLEASQGQLGQRALEAERMTSLDAISQATGLESQQVQELATIAQVAGIPLDRAAQLAGINLERVLGNANISSQDFENQLRAAGFNVGQQQTQFGQQLDLANLGLQEFQAGGSEEDRAIRELALLLQAIGTPMKENIVFNNPGTSGALVPILKGGGQALGTVAGSKLLDFFQGD